jgi:predicted ester cyclase
MDPERNAATLQRLYDQVMNGHNVDAADELITIDRPDNDPTFPPEFTAGRAGFKKLMMLLIGAFPGLRFTTELMVAGNDLVSAFTKLSGTHQGEFMAIPATGRPFRRYLARLLAGAITSKTQPGDAPARGPQPPAVRSQLQPPGCAHSLLPRTGQEMPYVGGVLSVRG